MTLQEAIAVLHSPAGRDETRRVHQLDRAVDIALQVIGSQRMTRSEAEQIVEGVARLAEGLFPGSRDTFSIVYGRRMQRVIGEVFGAAS